MAGLVRRSQQVNLRQSSRYTVIILAAVSQYSPPSPELHCALSLGDFITFLLTLPSSQAVQQSQVIRTNLHWFLFLRRATSFRVNVIISAYVMNKLEEPRLHSYADPLYLRQ